MGAELYSVAGASLVALALVVGSLLAGRGAVTAPFQVAALEGRRRAEEGHLSPLTREGMKTAKKMEADITRDIPIFRAGLQAAFEAKVKEIESGKAVSKSRVIVDKPVGLINRAERRRLGMKFPKAPSRDAEGE